MGQKVVQKSLMRTVDVTEGEGKETRMSLGKKRCER